MKLFHKLRNFSKPKTHDLFITLGLSSVVCAGVYQYYKYECDSIVQAEESSKKHSLFPESFMKRFKKAPGLNLELPVVEAVLTKAPAIPPPIDRDYPVQLVVNLDTTIEVKPISKQYKYPYWTFNGTVPGPFIRARVGDVMQVNYLNLDETGMAHNIDFHCVTGPGGGAEMLLAEKDEEKTGFFKLLTSGLFIYHCAAGPVPTHISNGMYGLMLVEPEEGLPKVDKEFYVMQSEFYCEPSDEDPKMMEHSYSNGLDEKPTFVVFNGREGSLVDNPLLANTGERIRFYFGNAGPNLSSSFHVIGAIFDKVFREGDLVSPPERNVQVTQVPPGGATMIEFNAIVPGNYSLIDHSIFRIEKGAVGFLKIAGAPRPDIIHGMDGPKRCPGCKLHQ